MKAQEAKDVKPRLVSCLKELSRRAGTDDA